MNTHPPNVLDSLTLVRSRPGVGAWLLALGIAGFSALPMSLPFLPSAHPNAQQNSEIGFFLLGAMLLIPALIGMGFLVKMEIRATDTGLCWWTWRGWRSASWNEVTDFYEKRLQKGQMTSIIETPARNITIQKDIWTNWGKLRDIVAQRANRALNDKWAERGARPNERWPMVFDYNTSDNRQMRVVGWISVPLMLLASIWFVAEKWERMAQDFTLLDWQWGLLTVVAPLLTFLLLIVPLPLLMFHIHYRGLKGRIGQRITATAEGLTFEDGTERQEISWEDISLVYSESARGFSAYTRNVIVGKHDQFDFTGYLREARVLRLLLQRLASEAVERGRDFSPDIETLGRPEEPDAIGEHIYHYRTRTNRALLWFLGTFGFGGFVAAVLAELGWMEHEAKTTQWVFAVLLTLPVLWAWWRYRAASIRTDATGLTQYGLFGKRFVAWNDIRDYYLTGDDIATFGNIEGTTEKIRFWYSISGRDKLFAEIARRAVYCPGKEWKVREKAKRDR